mgnify:CR=1 FL=1
MNERDPLNDKSVCYVDVMKGVVVGGVLLCIHVIFTYSKEPKPEEKP